MVARTVLVATDLSIIRSKDIGRGGSSKNATVGFTFAQCPVAGL